MPLSKSALEATPLLSQRCAALAGGAYSSFVVAGREAVPTEPGGWLASPLPIMGSDRHAMTQGLSHLTMTSRLLETSRLPPQKRSSCP